MIKRIHVRYHLTVDRDADPDVVERVHAFHAEKCPVARSIGSAVAISTEVATVQE